MPMYNLIQYSKNYRKTTGSLWNYYKDEPINPYLSPPVNSNPPTVNCDADPITNSASHLNTRALDKTLGKTLDSDDDNARNNNRRR